MFRLLVLKLFFRLRSLLLQQYIEVKQPYGHATDPDGQKDGSVHPGELDADHREAPVYTPSPRSDRLGCLHT